MIDYVITQTGKELSVDSTIRLQKLENKISRFIFEIEDWLKEFRLYVAILNPETRRFHYVPLLSDEEDEKIIYYLIVGTDITYYVGKTRLVLIGVNPEYFIDDNITLDPTNTVYVSKEFARLVVLDNFISDQAHEVSYPNIEKALDDFIVLHDNVVDIAIQTAQDLVDCNEALQKCEEDMTQCDADLERCEEILVQSTEQYNACVELEAQCEEHKTNCTDILSRNNDILTECNANLTESRNILSSCRSAMNSCSSALSQCNNQVSSASEILSRCQNILSQCQQQLTQIQSLRTTINNEYTNYMSNMSEAYNNYIQSIQNGGEP